MPTQITATLPTLDFPREVDYPTQEDWAAFSAAAEENFGILGGDWSTQMQLWKTQANAMSTELNTNADIAQGLANYQGDWVSQGYTLGQTVSVSGIYYICKLTHATGQNPTDIDSLYWNLALGNWSLKVDTNMSGYTSKTTPVDADLIPLSDSDSSFGIKKLSWANIKATLKTYFDTLYSKLTPTIATGLATFTNSTNNINLTGIGIGVEIGDVIQITGSTNNNGDFTVEVITDNNNIIINQAHAGKSRTVAPIGPKALINETATITVKLLAKWHNADSDLGKDWVDVTSNRSLGVAYPNITKRPIPIIIRTGSGASAVTTITTSDVTDIHYQYNIASFNITGYIEISRGRSYTVSGGAINKWSEKR